MSDTDTRAVVTQAPPLPVIGPEERATAAEGDLCRARDLGLSGRHRMIYARCERCKTPRWVVQARPAGLCDACNRAYVLTGQKRPHMGERQRGANNPNWHGGASTGGNGYLYMLVAPDDPLSSMSNREGYVMEHRLVMARALGRPLEKWERVHHINGDRLDNKIENLELWKLGHPSGVRHNDYHCAGCRCFEGERSNGL